MELWQIMTITVAVVVVVGIVGWAIYVQRRRRHLRDHFGPEYEQAVADMGSQRDAEAELAKREARVSKLNIRSLDPAERNIFVGRWKNIQAQFVDDPAGAVNAADNILGEIMRVRGYAFDHPDQRISDISAAYPQRVAEYRAACAVVRNSDQGDASTEDLRTAFVHYRTLFDELVGGKGEELRRAS